jgi:thiosulfate/3-mercaptopyruvate sulfurtransferase
MTSPLISVAQLVQQIKHDHQSVLLLDCRHDLMDHQLGVNAYKQGHIPGAQFSNMETDAAGAHTGTNGRHPLPERAQFCEQLVLRGLNSNQTLVVYDSMGGQFAVRIWWMARWIGHDHVYLLDGGLPAWTNAGHALETKVNESIANKRGTLELAPSLVGWIDAAQVEKTTSSKTGLLIDARAPARYRGETEPIDPVAGHIPGALNRFYQNNLGADGLFKPAAQLRQEFLALIGTQLPSAVTHQCGSGVTACHNILSMEVAGLSGSNLYPGSWSEWCSDPKRAIEKS